MMDLMEDAEPAVAIRATSGQGLYHYLASAVADHPDAIHMRFGDTAISYATSHDLVLRLAGTLAERGIGQGDRVGIALPNNPAYVILCYALWRIGACGVGMNLLYAPDHLVDQARDAGVRLIFGAAPAPGDDKLVRVAREAGCPLVRCSPGDEDFAADGAAAGSDLAAMLRGPRLAADAPLPDPQAPAMLQYTGGTTGRPKGAVLTHHAMMHAADAYLTSFPKLARGSECVYAAAPMTHVSGLMAYVCVFTAIAGEILLVSRFDPADLAAHLRAGRITFMGVIPTMLTAMLAVEGLDDVPWHRLKYLMAGGGPTSAALLRRVHETTGIWVQQGYGMTETCGVGLTMPVEAVASHVDATGLPVAGVTVEIRSLTDPSVRVDANEPGEICVGGECLMDGYWGVPGVDHLTRDGLMRTGDIGIADASGFIQVVDRLKDMVVCSGYNVYPRTIDEAVARHPAVQEAIAIGVPDDYRGETILVAAVLKPGMELTLGMLQGFLTEYLSPIEMPKQLAVVSQLPKSENGKLSRLLVREAWNARTLG